MHQPRPGGSAQVEFENHCIQVRGCNASGPPKLGKNRGVPRERSLGAQRPDRLHRGQQQQHTAAGAGGSEGLHLPASSNAGRTVVRAREKLRIFGKKDVQLTALTGFEFDHLFEFRLFAA